MTGCILSRRIRFCSVCQQCPVRFLLTSRRDRMPVAGEFIPWYFGAEHNHVTYVTQKEFGMCSGG